MNIIEELTSTSKKDFTKEWESVLWLLCSECGWSEEDVLNADIPFVFAILRGRTNMLKAQDRDAKRK